LNETWLPSVANNVVESAFGECFFAFEVQENVANATSRTIFSF
jgi:hypothetical protein